MKIVILDAKTLGDDIEFSVFNKLGDVSVYQTTSSLQLKDRIKDADIIIVNKIRLNKDNLTDAKKLKLICVTATGYDNIDINYCWHKGIGVCNVKGYSTDSVAQITVSMALSLASHLNEFNNYVKSGKYMISGVQNHLKPYFNELKGKTWGVIGLGNIGQRTADIAYALSMKIVSNSRRYHEGYEWLELDELCKVAACGTGAAAAVVTAVENGKIGGLGVDVYSVEPITNDSPYNRILDRSNVILTPHMAWGAYEARVRCMNEIVKNIETFMMGGKRNRVDIDI